MNKSAQFPKLQSSACAFISIQLLQSLLVDTSGNAGPHVSGISAWLEFITTKLWTSPLPLPDRAALPAVCPALRAERPAPPRDALERPWPQRCCKLCRHLGNIPLTSLCYIEELHNNPQINIKLLLVNN